LSQYIASNYTGAPPAAYPNAIKVFQVFHDYTDIIWAISINECHSEIVALESVVGTKPFTGTPYTTVGGAIQDLYTNKAPSNHTHVHRNLLDDTLGNDHPQYMQVNGYPGFSGPVEGRAGGNPYDLVPLSQLLSFGFQNAGQVSAMVNGLLGNLMAGAWGGAPLAGRAIEPNWTITGGVASGCTDGSGRVGFNFGHTFYHCVQSLIATKMPPAPGGCPPYNWIEAQLTLVGVSGTGAVLQFSHDYSWQPGMMVSFAWMVIGN
jgi:hypothetical protein